MSDDTETTRETQSGSRRLLTAGMALLLAALVLRLSWGFFIVSARGPEFVLEGQYDSSGYVLLARALLHQAISPDQEAELTHLLFLRTPGQPLYLAALLSLSASGSSAMAIVAANALLGAATVVLIWLTVRLLFPLRPYVAWIAAIASTLSPCAITLVPTGLSEIPFMAALWTGIYLFVSGLGSRDHSRVAVSGLFVAIAVLFRPVLLFSPLLLGPAAWLLGRHFKLDKVPWRVVAVTCLIPISIIGVWTFRNSQRYGITTYSGITATTLDAFLGFESFREVHPELSKDDAYREYFSGFQESDLWKKMAPHELYSYHQNRFKDVFFAHPGVVVIKALDVAKDTVRQRSIVHESQYPEGKFAWRAVKPVQKILINTVQWVCILSFVMLLARRQWETALLLSGYILYFIVLSGISNWQGSRLAYPAEPAIWCLAGLILPKSSNQDPPDVH